MKQYSMKVKEGKLLKVNLDIKKGKIKSIQISGDFFLYPEEKIMYLEKALIGRERKEVLGTIKRTIDKERIEVLGFSPINLKSLILKGFYEMETDNRQ